MAYSKHTWSHMISGHKSGSTWTPVHLIRIEIVLSCLGSRLWNELVKDNPFLCEIDCVEFKVFIEQCVGPNFDDGFCYVYVFYILSLLNDTHFLSYINVCSVSYILQNPYFVRCESFVALNFRINSFISSVYDYFLVVSLIVCTYIPSLYIFCTYKSFTSLLANVVCFKYDFE